MTTTYTYDALHRLLGKTYSPGTYVSAYFTDDVTSIDGLSGLTNTVGRQVKAEAKEGTVVKARTVNSYDEMGRIADQWQCTPQNCSSGWYTAHYDYNEAGALTSQSNPFGFTLTQSYDNAGRLAQLTSSLNDAQHPGTLLTIGSQDYHAHGAIKKMTYGNGLVSTMAFNSRLQPCRVTIVSSGTQPVQCTDAAANFLDFTYTYNHSSGNNGNVMSWSSSGKQVFTRNYLYDELNRIGSMSGTGGNCTGVTWTYDIWGNRTNQTTAQGGGACGEHHPTLLTNNRIQELGYDAAGNVTSDPASSASHTYDAEGRIVTSNSTLGNGAYVYDAHGKRVQKAAGGTITEFIYDASGAVAAERVVGAWTKAYVSLGGQLLAQYDNTANPATTYFAHQDHLGSTRLLTGVSQTVVECDGYQPFGELDTSICNPPAGTSTTTHKFTGKERDTESGLDYFGARYTASTTGRFMSPDPGWFMSTHIGSPRTWNLYTYVVNNPLNAIDPTGLDCVHLNSDRTKATVGNEKTQGECMGDPESGTTGTGGYWVDGTATKVVVYTNTNDVAVYGQMDNGTPTQAFYTDVYGTAQEAETQSVPIGDAFKYWNGGLTAGPPVVPTNFRRTINPYPFRLFGTHWCGPGGGGVPVNALDAACKVHDKCFDAAGLSATNNTSGGTISLQQAAAASNCNQGLYNAAGANSHLTGSTSIRFWLKNGDKIKAATFGFFGDWLAPGTRPK